MCGFSCLLARHGATSLHVPTHDASHVPRNGASPSSTAAATTRETRGRTRWLAILHLILLYLTELYHSLLSGAEQPQPAADGTNSAPREQQAPDSTEPTPQQQQQQEEGRGERNQQLPTGMVPPMMPPMMPPMVPPMMPPVMPPSFMPPPFTMPPFPMPPFG